MADAQTLCKKSESLRRELERSKDDLPRFASLGPGTRVVFVGGPKKSRVYVFGVVVKGRYNTRCEVVQSVRGPWEHPQFFDAYATTRPDWTQKDKVYTVKKGKTDYLLGYVGEYGRGFYTERSHGWHHCKKIPYEFVALFDEDTEYVDYVDSDDGW